jgi:hypothetical protein
MSSTPFTKYTNFNVRPDLDGRFEIEICGPQMVRGMGYYCSNGNSKPARLITKCGKSRRENISFDFFFGSAVLDLHGKLYIWEDAVP